MRFRYFRGLFHTFHPAAVVAGVFLLVCTALAAPAMGQFGSTIQYFAQAVINEGSRTSFTIHNPGEAQSLNVRVDFVSSSGAVLSTSFSDVPPGGTETVTLSGTGGPLTTGWARLTSSGDFTATEFFQLFVDSLQPRVGVLPSEPTKQARVSGFIKSDYKSGLAITNPSDVTATNVTIRARNEAGIQVAADKVVHLAPLEHRAEFLDELFENELSEYEGTLEVVSFPEPVVLLSLIQDQVGDVATVAAFTPQVEQTPDFSGYEVVNEITELVNESRFATRFFSVSCSPGKSVLGGGGRFFNAAQGDELVLAKSYPNFQSGWNVEYQVAPQNQSSTVNATVEVWAICAAVAPE